MSRGGRGLRRCAAFDPDFFISTLQFEFGDVSLNQEVYKLFQLFLIHEYCWPSGLNLDQVLGGRSQNFVPRLSDENHIFDSNSAIAGYVNSRLNGDNHSWNKFLGLALGQARRLVYLDTHSVTCRVSKVRLIPRFF